MWFCGDKNNNTPGNYVSVISKATQWHNENNYVSVISKVTQWHNENNAWIVLVKLIAESL